MMDIFNPATLFGISGSKKGCREMRQPLRVKNLQVFHSASAPSAASNALTMSSSGMLGASFPNVCSGMKGT